MREASAALPTSESVTADNPCPICGGSSWCLLGERRVMCYRKFDGCSEQKTDRQGNAFAIHPYPAGTNPPSARFSSSNSTASPLPSSGKIESDICECAEVYKKLLAHCQLSKEHRDNLKIRGLCDGEVNTRRYATLPAKTSGIVKKLRDEFGDELLLRVPGFAEKTNSSTGETFIAIASGPGLLIPVRNILGMIVAVKVRLDQPNRGGRFRCLSSAKSRSGKRGPGAIQAVHLPYARKSNRPIGNAEVVRVTEGELKADVATALDGSMSTISVPGVGNWRLVLPVLENLGAKVIHLAFDADAFINPDVARHLIECHARLVASGLDVRTEIWPLNEAKGIDDLLALGKQPSVLDGEAATEFLDHLKVVAENRTKQSPTLATGKPLPFLSNVGPDAKGNLTITLSMAQILADVDRLTNGWPRRVGSALFVPSQDGGVCWIGSPESLMGFVGYVTGHPPMFATTAGKHTKREVFAELQRTAKNYAAVETTIHEPPLVDHFYATQPPQPGNGEHLTWLLDRFSPETPIDRDLIQAALMTLLWGGPGGSRPAFVFTADEGRGSGKSKTVAMLSEVIGGHIEVSSSEEAGIMRQRLLSPEGLAKRLAVLDNVKSHRFSWSELEALITAGVISGKRMYVGEAQRPNTLTWAITLNGVSLSRDLAQRAVIIKLSKPKFDPLWEETTRAYIREHRTETVADLVAALRADQTPLARYSRWSAWERDVLSRLPEPIEAQRIVAERQKVADVEEEEAGIIESFFSTKLSEFAYDPSVDRVYISSTRAAKWLGEAVGERMGTTAASRKLGQLIDEGAVRCIIRNLSKHLGRGFNWLGPEFSPDHQILCDLEDRISNQSWRPTL